MRSPARKELKMPKINYSQVAALKETGLSDEQICNALQCSAEELVESAVDRVMCSKDGDYGPIMAFTPDQVTAARNMIMQIALMGDSDSTRLKACNMILNVTSISAESKYRNAKGLDKTGTINNIMIAVGEAQAKKLSLLNAND